ncbi:hypothetical protein cce_3860 [Crocosphaera subtropica ATCC 51142]|uniref:Uncharacterized protein n=1 Tax=Crocosphaera subtropica (strain ATCC 51142 / BH68) TaxID=43989 RepID=B1WP29_CROS5|nr:hypothetical protein [Crocosphaera subtropica]ACB53208.1 hypothetical protein cce_3860 [Crocosphaera subtropica ATCC 51142]
MIDNALTFVEIQTYLNQYGYTKIKLQEGKKLYSIALEAYQKQQQRYGQQMSSTKTVNELWKNAKDSYMRCVKIARVAFKDNNGIARTLGLNGKRKTTLSGWLNQAKQFYQNALNDPEILKRLTEYGITKTKLEVVKTDTDLLENASLIREKEKGDAQNATDLKDQALENLRLWLKDFIAIAKIALETEPQLLEGLGVLKRS